MLCCFRWIAVLGGLRIYHHADTCFCFYGPFWSISYLLFGEGKLKCCYDIMCMCDLINNDKGHISIFIIYVINNHDYCSPALSMISSSVLWQLLITASSHWLLSLQNNYFCVWDIITYFYDPFGIIDSMFQKGFLHF